MTTMATQDFAASWVDVYNRVGGWSKKHSSHPIRTGGGSGTNWQTFIRIPEAVKEAANSSTTPPQLQMRINFTTAANEIDIGHHRTNSARSVGASGLPWYAYNETWRSIGTGWRTYEMSNWFLPNFLSGNVQGIVLYSYQGQFTNTATGLGQSNHVRFRVTGTWNTPPTTPPNARLDKAVADVSQTFRWNASSDAEQSQSELRYDVEFFNGNSYSRVSTRQSGLSFTRNTTNDAETTQAQFRVRAYDGELTSSWAYSHFFEIKHVPPSFSSSAISYLDRNSTTVEISGNNQHIIQNASLPRASVNSAASGNDGKTISRYIFTLGGQERTRTSLGSVDFNSIDASYNQTLRVTAEDSAGLRTTVTRTVTVIAYQQPQLQYSAQRLGNLSDSTLMKLSGSISSLSGSNSLQTTRYRYRTEGGSYGSWFTFNRSISGSSFTTTDVTLQLDNTTGFEIEIQVSDRLTTRIVVVTVRSGRPITFTDVDLNSFGVNKFPENHDSFEVANESIFEEDSTFEKDVFVEGELFSKGEKVEVEATDNWITINLLNGWTHNITAQYKVDRGRVWLRGRVDGRNASNDFPSNLPSSVRPIELKRFPATIWFDSHQTGTLRMQENGNMSIQDSPRGIVHLDGISWDI